MSETEMFATRYEHMSDAELLRVAADREDLMPEAAAAIDAELTRRHFSVAAAKKETRRAERKGTRRAIGNLGFSVRGYGKHFFGVSNYHRDESVATEQFDSTLWFWIMWLPVVPLASYHIERQGLGKSLWWSLKKQPFSASNEAPPFFTHVILGWVFSIVTAVIAFRVLEVVLRAFL